ncbi:MAG: DUF1592 domain-containing protein [Acidobacteriota bacterium]|nr:DUF1592 domain-containing protein [Acidobacteriota bacterium]
MRRSRFWRGIVLAALGGGMLASPGLAAVQSTAERGFTETVQPFVRQHCTGCHGGASPVAQFDLASYGTFEAVVEDHARWELVMERLDAGEMPPAGQPEPPREEREKVITWIREMRDAESRRRAGDPGRVLSHRLSNAEYSYTIRDLTGVDLRPTREFPVDPANLEGFDNSGESLTMSSSLLTKYLQAAREVSAHLVLTPDGLDFAPHPMRVETDREKYAIQRIVDFYRQQPTDYADYFEAAWHYKHHDVLPQVGATLESVATERQLSTKYLLLVWQNLEGSVTEEVGPIATLRRMWHALPPPDADGAETLRTECLRMRDFVVEVRRHTAMQFAAPEVDGLSPWSQPLINWKYDQFASHRREFDRTALRQDSDPEPAPPEIPGYPRLGEEAAPRARALQLRARAGSSDLVVPDGELARYERAFAEFANVFPDAFYVSERGRFYPDDSADKGRFLSAGYHNVMGYYRDDQPLQELVLDDEGRVRLDRLWDEFDFIADYTGRTWVQYFFNQSGEVHCDARGGFQCRESGSNRPSDAKVSATSVILELRDAYLAKATENLTNDPIAPEAIQVHFHKVDDTLRRVERMRVDAEPLHLEALLAFAERAYRRPLTTLDGEDLLAYYRSLREVTGLSHVEAARDSIVSILMAPDFLYRLDLVDAMSAPNAAPRPAAGRPADAVEAHALSPYALANRLSYFLWSSMPDAELLDHAADGSLLDPGVLVAQARRMLKDPRVRGLATEFAGNWLEFRRFEQLNSVDRLRFPGFDGELRQAMFEEPVRMMEDVLRQNRSVLDLVYGDYTFVNPTLARHYGMPQGAGDETVWVRVDGAGRYDRGGLLPMAAFLTQSSPGLRTSPVKRGFWIVRRILGETIPPPPPSVPELPADETTSTRSVREMMAQHRENPMCAACHARFDAFGLAFEGYGPVGERRETDLAGRLVDAHAEFPGGASGEGLAGVQRYIQEHRQDEYVATLARKMLAFGLSRSLLLSDEPLIEQVQATLEDQAFRIGSLVETIITSPQFRNRRNPDVQLDPVRGE